MRKRDAPRHRAGAGCKRGRGLRRAGRARLQGRGSASADCWARSRPEAEPRGRDHPPGPASRLAQVRRWPKARTTHARTRSPHFSGQPGRKKIDRLRTGDPAPKTARGLSSARPASSPQMSDLHHRGASTRSEALDHVLIFGPAGSRQDHACAHHCRQRDGRQPPPHLGPGPRTPGDLAAILTNLEPNDVLFVDEIHRLSPVVEEVLYPAMEDFQLDIMIGEGPAARSIKLDLPPFTLVGATTRAGLA